MARRPGWLPSLVIALGIVGASLLLVGPASAAMWSVLTVSPERPTVGEPAEVLIRSFATFGSDAVGAFRHDGPIPAPSDTVLVLWGATYPYRLVAVGPAEARFDVAVRPDGQDASLNRGTVVFPTSGQWRLELPQFPAPATAPGVRLNVTVAEAEPTAEGMPSLAVATVLGALGGAVLASLLRRRAGHPGTIGER